MYLLYLDESGNEDDPKDRYFVLAGAAIFERTAHFISQEFETLKARHFPGRPPIEFHAAQIRAGKGFWRNVERERKEAILEGIAEIIARANDPGLVLFACAVEKSDTVHGEKAVELATSEICGRFDLFLKRRFHESKDPQRGLLIFSEGKFDHRAKVWVRDFREVGTRRGYLNNLVDIPYFAASKETRLLQLADFVAHAVFLFYERGDAQLIRPILRRFDQKDGILHGLVHYRVDPESGCECPACGSRRTPGRFEKWT